MCVCFGSLGVSLLVFLTKCVSVCARPTVWVGVWVCPTNTSFLMIVHVQLCSSISRDAQACDRW